MDPLRINTEGIPYSSFVPSETSQSRINTDSAESASTLFTLSASTLFDPTEDRLGAFKDLPPSSPPRSELPILTSPIFDFQEINLGEDWDEWEDINDETLVNIVLPSSQGAALDSDAGPPNHNTPLLASQNYVKGQICYADSSDPGVNFTSPVTKTNRRQKSARRSVSTRQGRIDALKNAEMRRITVQMDGILDGLQAEGIGFGALFKYALDTRPKGWLWENLFKFSGLAEKILDVFLSSRNSKTGQETTETWAVNVACRAVYREGERTTKSGLLRVRPSDISASFVRKFDFKHLFGEVRHRCPNTIKILRSFATTNRQQKKMSDSLIEKKLLVRSYRVFLIAKKYHHFISRHPQLPLHYLENGVAITCISGLCSVSGCMGMGPRGNSLPSVIT